MPEEILVFSNYRNLLKNPKEEQLET